MHQLDVFLILVDVVEQILVCSNFFGRRPIFVFGFLAATVAISVDHLGLAIYSQLSIPAFAVSWGVMFFGVVGSVLVGAGGVQCDMRGSV